MANLTIALEDELLQQARIRATGQGTSVNAVLREYLSSYVGVTSKREEAVKNLLRLSKRARSGRGRRKWTRDELHER